jgi:hypothetical protein
LQKPNNFILAILYPLIQRLHPLLKSYAYIFERGGGLPFRIFLLVFLRYPIRNLSNLLYLLITDADMVISRYNEQALVDRAPIGVG